MKLIEHELFPGFFIGDNHPVIIMGIVNLSPESFYSDSYIPQNTIKSTILKFIKNGAKILDFGARSTAPWSDPITLNEEMERIQKALDLLPGFIPENIVISIDTQHREVAELALEFGKQHKIPMILNDISSFHTDPSLIDVLKKYNCPVIIMATNNKPGDAKSPKEIKKALECTFSQLKINNYDISKVIIDPGIGKWVKEKTYQYDLAMLDNLDVFRDFSQPILIGLSRKSFIGTVLDEKEPKNRDIGSLSSTSIAVYNGAHIIRTHDVDRAMIQTIQMASAIRGKPFPPQDENYDKNIETDKELKIYYRKEW